MPELPEVETVLRGLRRHVLGRKINRVDVLTPSVIVGPAEFFTGQIKGRPIVALARKGKALAVHLEATARRTPGALLVRLGMTGQLVLLPCEAPLLPHTHARIVLDGGVELRFRDTRRFGRLRYCTGEELEGIFSLLGPDALKITEQQFQQSLKKRRGAIKALLLNQAVISGLGNIYADEALFSARIHPETPAGKITRVRSARLLQAIRKVLHRAVDLQGTSFRDYIDIEGRPGRFRQRLHVYQRTGQPCLRCGNVIRRIVISGRSSHFCPRCQPPSRSRAR